MRKIFVLIVCLFLTAGFFACDAENGDSGTQGGQSSTTERSDGNSDNDDSASENGVWTPPQKQ